MEHAALARAVFRKPRNHAMFELVHFESADGGAHVLWRRSAANTWAPSAHHVELAPERAAHVLHGAVYPRQSHPRWQLLHALGIQAHPADLAPHELRSLLSEKLSAHARRYVVYRSLRIGAVQAGLPSVPRTPPPPVADKPPLDFVHVQLVDDEGIFLQSVLLEMTLPDGQQRMLSTDWRGSILVEGITPGGCSARLSETER